MARMSLSDILLLYRARLRARAVLAQEGFAILGIAIGVGLLFASQVASTSLTNSVQALANQAVGGTRYQLQARGPAGVDGRLLSEVRSIPGVRQALPMLEVQANLIGPNGRQRSLDVLGTSAGFAQSSGPLLRRYSKRQLAHMRAIALPQPLAEAVGVRSGWGPVKLEIGSHVVHTLVGAALQEADVGGLVHDPIAMAPVSYLQRIAKAGDRLTQVYVAPAPGHDRQVRSALMRLAARTGTNFEPADFASTLFAVASAPETQGETLFSVISAIVGFMFALNAMLITVPARRRLIEDIRPQGATRLMTLQILLFDAAVLGMLACVIGLALGELLSIVAFRATPGYLSSAFPIGDARVVTVQSVLVAVSAGMLAAIVGVLWPLRDILGRPLQAGRRRLGARAGVSTARLGAGIACLLVTTLIVLFRSQDAMLGNFTLVIALVCLLPLIFDRLLAGFDRVQRLTDGAASVLALTELQTPHTRVRSLAIAATAAIAVFGIVAIGGAQSNLQRGLDATAHEVDSQAAVWITTKGESAPLATDSFQGLALGPLERVPGVASVGVYRGSYFNWGDRRLWVLGQPSNVVRPIPATGLIGGNAALAMSRIKRGGWAVLSQALASEHHLHVGEAFTLPTVQPLRLRIAALSTNLGWPPGAIIMNASDYARAWGSVDPSAYEIQTTPGTSASMVREAVQQILGSNSALRVETRLERQTRHYALISQGLSRLAQIRWLVLIAAVLAVAGAMGAMIWQRRDLIAFIKRQGYAKSVLWRWLLCESALLLTSGCLIGAVFGLYGQTLISHALAAVTGFPIFFHIGVVIALSSFALVSALALAIASVASYWVVRVPPSTVSPAY